MTIDPLSSLEQEQVHRAKAEETAMLAKERARQSEAEADALRFRALIPTLTPKRDGCEWDWRVGAFRNAEGLVYRASDHTWVTDQFTPNAQESCARVAGDRHPARLP
jgi:hypothetical protein